MSQEKISSLAKDSLHLVKANLVRMNSDIQKAKNGINDKIIMINHTWDAITRLTRGWEVLSYHSAVSMATNEIILALDQCMAGYQKMEATLNMAKVGKIHPSLFSTIQIGKIIKDIAENHGTFQFPLERIRATPDRLAEISNVKLGYKDGRLMFEILIPLLEKGTSALYRIQSKPIYQKHNNTIAFVKK